MNPDRPVDALPQDGFHFYALARQLAPHLILPTGAPSLVTGIEAPWGSGKTSFVNLTRIALRRINSEVLILDYCPWIYSTVDSLILGFCVQMATQLESISSKDYTAISNAFLGLSKALKPFRLIPGADSFFGTAELVTEQIGKATKAAGQMKSLDISNARRAVQKALDKRAKSVVIFVDDVDRLAPPEIRLLFQFLKAVADFNGVSYVLAYDPKPVEQALSYDKTLDGREYLKKFVQLPIRLPRLSHVLMRRFIYEHVKSLVESPGLHLDQSEKNELLERATSGLVLKCLSTPRDAVRCFNLLRLRLPTAHEEIHSSELLIFVLIDLICPEAIALVRDRPELFISNRFRHAEFGSSYVSAIGTLWKDRKGSKEEREELFKTLPELQRNAATELLNSLFPPVLYESASDVRSATSSYGLIKLLYGESSPLAFSVKETRAFLNGEGCSQTVGEQLSNGTLKEWLYFLFSITEGSSVRNPQIIAIILIDACKSIETNDGDFQSVKRVIAAYILELAGKCGSPKEAYDFLEFVIKYSDDLSISHHILVDVALDAGLWDNGVAYPLTAPFLPSERKMKISSEPQRIIALENQWLEKVNDYADRNILHEQPDLGSILHRWGQFPANDYSAPEEYIRCFVETNDAMLLLQRFPISVDRSGLEKLFTAHDSIIASLSRYSSLGDLRSIALTIVNGFKKDAFEEKIHSNPENHTEEAS